MWTLLFALAHAGCPEEAPPLTLSDRMWLVQGGSWETATHTVSFSTGVAFEVVGAATGIVVVGPTQSAVRDTDGSLLAALRRELELTVPAGPAWVTEADVAWRLGADGVQPGWLPLHTDRTGAYGTGEDGMPFFVVYEPGDLTAMRATATRAIADRARALADAGYPLASLAAMAPTGWSVMEARTTAPLGALVGPAGLNADPWLTTLVDDLTLDGGRRVATVSFGTRYVEGLSGC